MVVKLLFKEKFKVLPIKSLKCTIMKESFDNENDFNVINYLPQTGASTSASPSSDLPPKYEDLEQPPSYEAAGLKNNP